MKALILALCVTFLPMGVYAKIVGKTDGPKGSLLLSDDKCTNSPFYKWTAVDLKAKPMFSGCWFAHGNTVIFLADDGQVMTLEADSLDWSGGT